MFRLLLALLVAGAARADEPDCGTDVTSLIQAQSGADLASGSGSPSQQALARDLSASSAPRARGADNHTAEANYFSAEMISTGALRKEAALMGVIGLAKQHEAIIGGNTTWVLLAILLCFLLPGMGWICARCLGHFVKASIESLDQTIIGVDVVIGRLSINPCLAYILMEDVTIANPEGYLAPYLMKIDTVYIDVDAGALFRSLGKDVVVDNLVLTGLDTIYAKKMFTSNFNDVIHFMEGDDADGRRNSQTSQSTGESQEQDASQEQPSDRKITLHQVRVEDAGMKMEMEMGGGVGPRVEVGDLIYDHFSEELGGKGAMLRTAISLLLRTILKSVVVTTIGKSRASTFSEMKFLKSHDKSRGVGKEGQKRSSWFRSPWICGSST